MDPDAEVQNLLIELAEVITQYPELVDEDIQALGNLICDLLPDCSAATRQKAALCGLYAGRSPDRRVILAF